jgi:aldose 1-epimerase
VISLAAGLAKAEVLPAIGAGLAGLSVGGRPVLRPWSGVVTDGPFVLAMNLLAPFSNRISGGFSLAGTTHQLAPNLAGETFPIHGDAFQRQWLVTGQDDASVTLSLEIGDCHPFRYDAQVTYRLTPTALQVCMGLTSRAAMALPFGLGFHPWFPRSAKTKLLFHATGYWPEDSRHLPSTTAPVPVPARLNFAELAALPADWINAGFAGWTGFARIAQGPEAVSVVVKADLSTAILFSPSSAATFFCFEPVSHPVDAHNLPGMPGLTLLAPGETLTAEMTLDWT